MHFRLIFEPQESFFDTSIDQQIIKQIDLLLIGQLVRSPQKLVIRVHHSCDFIVQPSQIIVSDNQSPDSILGTNQFCTHWCHVLPVLDHLSLTGNVNDIKCSWSYVHVTALARKLWVKVHYHSTVKGYVFFVRLSVEREVMG